MKISKLKVTNLQNAEHFQFHADVLALVQETTPAALKSEEQCAAYKSLFGQEDDIMKQILRSAITEQIAGADHARDVVFRGLADAYRSALNHFDPAKVAAAERLAPLFDVYGNLAGESLAKQTADTFNFLKDLLTKHAADCEALGLNDWITELDRRNNAVQALMRDRYEETAARPEIALRAVRLQVDGAYAALAERVEALQLIEGGVAGAPYAAFIGKLNAVIERAANILAQRRGRAKAEKEEEAKKSAEAGAGEAATAGTE
jgi:hypothetical protein